MLAKGSERLSPLSQLKTPVDASGPLEHEIGAHVAAFDCLPHTDYV